MSNPESKDDKIAADVLHGAARARKHDAGGARESRESHSSKMKIDLAQSFDEMHLATPAESSAARRDSQDSQDSQPKLADIISSKSMSCTNSKDKSYISESPHSESFIGNSKKASASSVSKVLAWDPWDKLSRKRKENRKRKSEKPCEPCAGSSSCPPPAARDKEANRKDFKSGDEALCRQESQQPVDASYEEYVYQPYKKTVRSVEFTNKVMVVYINKEDKVVGEASEPLKKELEQQIRNKEMRRGHMPDVTFARRSVVGEWFKK